MEVFCRNVPGHLKKQHLKKELKPILAEFDIIEFDCRTFSKNHAIITIVDNVKAGKLLKRYPKISRGQKLPPEHQLLKIRGTIIYIEKGRNSPDPHLLLSLQEEETKRLSRPSRPLSAISDSDTQRKKKFHIQSLSCGVFDFQKSTPIFVQHYRMEMPGTIDLGPKTLKINLASTFNDTKTFQFEFDYWSISNAIYVSNHGNMTITFSCDHAPRIYEAPIDNSSQVALNAYTRIRFLAELLGQKKKRLSYIEESHKHIVATCFVYRVSLKNPHETDIWRLPRNPNRPNLAPWKELVMRPLVSFQNELVVFVVTLTRAEFPFVVKFQLQMLVWNGDLPIAKALDLFSYVKRLLSREKPLVVAKILKKFSKRLVYPDPHTDCHDVSKQSLYEILKEVENTQASEYLRPGQPGYLSSNQIEIHRASVTPTGIYLDGPNYEAENRVLRKFRRQSDYFLRVRFIEESGDPMMYDINADLDGIFNGRFHEVLKDGIIIAGRHYEFLGFSNSSLRTRACWFMADFYDSSGEHITVESLKQKLGDFSHLRSPAKFAARLGQTFSDTLTSISVDRDMIKKVPDIKRNGRVFSDGCGTISEEILWRIYRDYPRNAAVPPTVFQVRISGAKGMLSLDSSLKGPVIRLRDSMIKFRAEADMNIEICGSGIKKLPCYLNAPLIKILEDRGVANDLFLELQRQEIESLRQTVQSPEQATMFLEQSNIAKSTRLSWLISVLLSLGLHYENDSFLKRAVELALLMKLRDLKYKARILVPDAVTLYGVMDETGILKEGEIFVPILNDQNHREILVHEKVLVTRSPAFHPGDVQLANAVNVPEDSPLHRIHNCVVFSQHGARDLPSQLSGGDLDGDLFNIIYDDRFRLCVPADPADYPRVHGIELDRPVTMEDIKGFFIDFMRQDQLGRIATTHKIIADQAKDGTFDPRCLKLAELHSTAVDFSKTGTPVDVTKIPKFPPCRPDFMAPGPRVKVAESIEVLEKEEEHIWRDDEDEDARPPIRYYQSKRVLGDLYRMIDEQEFINDLKWELTNKTESVDILQSIWEYVQRETVGFIWDHYIQDAQNVRDIYEGNLEDLMYRYSEKPWKTKLTEVEVFIGTIVGQNHKQTTYQKESSRAMKEAYDDLVKWIMSIIIGKDTPSETESLERSVACFQVSLDRKTTSSVSRDYKELRSYTWIAAITCLHEIDKFKRAMPLPF